MLTYSPNTTQFVQIAIHIKSTLNKIRKSYDLENVAPNPLKPYSHIIGMNRFWLYLTQVINLRATSDFTAILAATFTAKISIQNVRL